MAVTEYHFSGKVAWLIPGKTNKYGKYSLNLYPDAATRKAIKETGIKNKVQEDDGKKSGIEGLFYVLRSDIAFPVMDPDGNAITTSIGNGSDVTVRLEVDTFDSAYGPNARSSVTGVVVNTLIPYEKKEAKEKAEQLPV